MKGYATASRRKILDYLKSNSNRTATVTDIDRYLKESGSQVNITTIYRYLDKLAGEGMVMKYAAEKGGQTVYQYVGLEHHCEDHLHLKCVCCGSIIHLECAFMEEIYRHVLEEHGFKLQCRNSMLYGTCQMCRDANKSEIQNLPDKRQSEGKYE